MRFESGSSMCSRCSCFAPALVTALISEARRPKFTTTRRRPAYIYLPQHFPGTVFCTESGSVTART